LAHLQTAENAEVILKKRGVPDKFINAIAKRKKGSKAYIFIPFAWIPILLFSVIPFHDFYFQILYTIYPIRASQSDLFFPDGLSMMVVFGLMVILGLSLPAWAMLGYFYQPALDPILDEDILYKVAVKIRSISFGEDINSLRPNPNFLRFSGLLSEDEFLSAVAGVDREARKSARAPVRRFIIAVFSSQCLITTMAVLWMHYSYANIFNNTLELSAPFFHRKVSMAEITSAKTACIYQPTRSNPHISQP
jgi:hypothetical protein